MASGTVVTTQDIKNLLNATLNMVWLGKSKMTQDWERFTETRAAYKSEEETQEMMGVTPGRDVPEATALPIGKAGQAFKTKYPIVTYGNSIYLTMQEMQDNLYKQSWQPKSMGFVTAQLNLRNVEVFKLINQAGSTTRLGGDGKPLLSTTHPMYQTTYANTWAQPVTLTQTTYQQMVETTMLMENYVGIKMSYVPRCLVGPVQGAQNMKVLMFSPDDPMTANRSINALFGDYFKDGMVVSPYIYDPLLFLGFTSAEQGMIFFRRMDFVIDELPATNTLVAGWYGVERFGTGWADPRCVVGSTFLN